MILGFRREVDENCDLLGYYAPGRGDFLLTFRDSAQWKCPLIYMQYRGTILKVLEDGTSAMQWK